MKEGTRLRICSVCEQAISPDEDPHFLHDPDCREGCDCDRPVHADCCPGPECRGEGQ